MFWKFSSPWGSEQPKVGPLYLHWAPKYALFTDMEPMGHETMKQGAPELISGRTQAFAKLASGMLLHFICQTALPKHDTNRD